MSIVQTKFGRMRIIDADNVVSRALSLYGEWALDEIALIERVISPGMCVLDVGAFIGTHSLAFSEFVGPQGKVYSFEPHNEIYQVLLENLGLNELENVTAVDIGLSDEESVINLQHLDIAQNINFGGLELGANNETAGFDDYQVRLLTIDKLGIDRIDIVKLDVEGMERAVLCGATEVIARDRPLFFCECNSVYSGTELWNFCQQFGYESYGFLASAFNPENFNSNETNIFGAAKELELVLIPLEKVDASLEKFKGIKLFPINDPEDIVLALLHKPQYAYEILVHTASFPFLGINFPSPALVERDDEIGRRDIEIARLNKELTDFNEKLLELNLELTGFNDQVADLSKSMLERDKLITELQTFKEVQDEQIVKLSNDLTDREYSIQSLNEILAERNSYIATLVNSNSWLITKPIRWTGRLVRGDFIGTVDPLKKIRRSLFGARRSNGDAVESCTVTDSNAIVTVSPIERSNSVAVILPVYRGIEMTKRCILAAMPGILAVDGARLVVINDASPDVGMQAMLMELAVEWPQVFLLLENEKNLGFVRTVNRGFASLPLHDAVLLNSDVIVPQNWLARLIAEAYSRHNVATVTPFSNNATICSFPYFLQENDQPFDLDVDSVDAAFKFDRLPCIQAPTGVGFCMYIRRACLDEIGYLNEEKFGRGYGEENDLCQRAVKTGWLNLISPNMFAYHEGGVSFSHEKQALVTRALGILNDLHPNYHADVQRFITADPVRPLRLARYVQLLRNTKIAKVLHISHAAGGGVKQHIEELAKYFEKRMASLLLTPLGSAGEICVEVGVGPLADSVVFDVDNGYADLIYFLKATGVSAVHFHHTHGFDQKIVNLAFDLNVPHIVTVHDYYWLAANPTLTDEAGRYPGYYSDRLNNPLYPLPSEVSVKNWQSQFKGFIEEAECVIFPSNSTKRLFNNVYQSVNSIVAPHIEPYLNVEVVPLKMQPKAVFVIGVLGALGREKGADLLEEIAGKASLAKLNVKFKLIGYAYRALDLVEITGPYETRELKSLIQENGLDLVLFTAQWPETYSYTLSYALDSGLPIIAPNVGAFPERLSGRSNTILFDISDTADEIVSQLKIFVEQVSKAGQVNVPIFKGDESFKDFYKHDYLALVSRNLDNIDNINFNVQSGPMARILGSRLRNKKSPWREALVHFLWRMRMNPTLRVVSEAIPANVRRKIRLALSNSNIHDVARGLKGRR